MNILIGLLVAIIVLLCINAWLHTKTEQELENGIKARDEGLKSITNLNTHLVDMLLRQNMKLKESNCESNYFITEDVLKELLTKTNTKVDENAIRRTMQFLQKNQEIKG